MNLAYYGYGVGTGRFAGMGRDGNSSCGMGKNFAGTGEDGDSKVFPCNTLVQTKDFCICIKQNGLRRFLALTKINTDSNNRYRGNPAMVIHIII